MYRKDLVKKDGSDAFLLDAYVRCFLLYTLDLSLLPPLHAYWCCGALSLSSCCAKQCTKVLLSLCLAAPQCRAHTRLQTMCTSAAAGSRCWIAASFLALLMCEAAATWEGYGEHHLYLPLSTA